VAIEGLFRGGGQGVIRRSFVRPDPGTLQIFQKVYSAFALDHFGKHGSLDSAIRPLFGGARVCGPAVTVLGPDLTVRRMAIDLAQPGDVLVVAAGGFHNRACFGDGTALKMKMRGLAGAVIDGMTRDSDGITELEFPVFSRGATPRNFHYPEDGHHGAINVDVVCGGVQIKPGDIILADGDGVVSIDREAADREAHLIDLNFRKECIERENLKEFSGFHVEQELMGRGYQFID